MTTHKSPDDEEVREEGEIEGQEDAAASARARAFSRRAILGSSWAVPVVLAVKTADASLSPSIARHGDGHLDTIIHGDGHGDIAT